MIGEWSDENILGGNFGDQFLIRLCPTHQSDGLGYSDND